MQHMASGTTDATIPTRQALVQQCPRSFAGTRRPPVSVITTLYYVAIIFHRRVWYCVLSLRYVRIRKNLICRPHTS